MKQDTSIPKQYGSEELDCFWMTAAWLSSHASAPSLGVLLSSAPAWI